MKCKVTNETAQAINEITKRTGRTQADIQRSAFDFYIKQNYPEYLSKSVLEIKHAVKSKYQFDKQFEKYTREQTLLEQIPTIENILKE